MKSATVAILLVSSLAQAGAVLVSERKQKGETTNVTLTVEGARLRIDGMRQQRGGASALIFDGEAKKLMAITTDDKTYMELTEADVQALGGQMATMRAAMEAQLAGMPPEQRKQVEAMMAARGGGMPGAGAGPAKKRAERTYKSVGQKKTVRGFPCEMYKVLVDGKAIEESCFADWSRAGVGPEDFKGLEKLKEFVSSLTSQFGGTVQDDSFVDFTRAPGFPVARAGLGENGSVEWTEELVSAKRQSVPADKFSVPPGYTKKAMGPPPRRPGAP